MGKGPFCFIENGLVETLKEKSYSIEEVVIESKEAFTMEIGTSFELLTLVAGEVRNSLSNKAFPIILAGNCNTTVGAISGLPSQNPGLIWFDAHGDFNTPETTTSGFLDAMGLSLLTGKCWQEMVKTIPGFQPLPEEQVLLIGARDFDDMEYSRLESSEITHLKWDELRELGVDKAMNPHLHRLSRKVGRVYLHVDMDVHDANLAPANLYKPEGGLTPMEVRDAVRNIARQFHICGASVTAFDPDSDENNKGLHAGIELIKLICEIAFSQEDKNISS
jgi:arginase